MKKTAKQKADCKPAAKALHRAILATEARMEDGGSKLDRPDPTKRRPGSLSRSILGAVLLLSSFFYFPSSAFGTVTVTGMVYQVTGAALDTKVTFTPWEDVTLLANGLSAGPAKTISSTNGAFGSPLDPGRYLVRLPLVGGRNAFTVDVPVGTGSINITSIISAPWTYEQFVATMNGGNAVTAAGLSVATTNGAGVVTITTPTNSVIGLMQQQTPLIIATNNGSQNQIRYITRTPPTTGDTNYFGPWTPGTTTSGIQEAWDSAYKGTNYGPYINGVEIHADSGYWFFTNKLEFKTQYPFETHLRGVGLLSTKFAFAGTNDGISCMLFGSTLDSSPGRLNLPAHVTLEDCSLTAIQDMNTNILLEVRDYSDLTISRVNFTGWQALTNQVDGAGVSLDGASVAGVTNASLVGLKVWRGPEHNTFISKSYFMQLAFAIDAQNDHCRGDTIQFAHIGIAPSRWPATSRYSLGLCVGREGGLNDLWTYLHCYSAKSGFFLLAEAFNSPMLIGCNFESCQNPLGSLAANHRTPISFNQTVYGDTSWAGNGAQHVLCVSNSPNWGVMNVVHTNGVVLGVDQYNASTGLGAFEVWYGGTQRFLVDSLGSKTEGRIDINNTGLITLNPKPGTGEGVFLTDGVNENQLLPDGSARFATDKGGFDTVGRFHADQLLSLNYHGAPGIEFQNTGAVFQMNDKVNSILGVWIYNFTTGVFGLGEMTATKGTIDELISADGHAIDRVRPKMGTNSVAVTPNISLYLTNFDGSVYRLSAQRIVP